MNRNIFCLLLKANWSFRREEIRKTSHRMNKIRLAAVNQWAMKPLYLLPVQEGIPVWISLSIRHLLPVISIYKGDTCIAIESVLAGDSTQRRRAFLPYQFYGLSNGRKYQHLVKRWRVKVEMATADRYLLNLLERHRGDMDASNIFCSNGFQEYQLYLTHEVPISLHWVGPETATGMDPSQRTDSFNNIKKGLKQFNTKSRISDYGPVQWAQFYFLLPCLKAHNVREPPKDLQSSVRGIPNPHTKSSQTKTWTPNPGSSTESAWEHGGLWRVPELPVLPWMILRPAQHEASP